MKILIADDDAVYRSLLERMLKQWEYEVIVTCDGQEALDVLHGPDPPKLLIVDWMMPHVDGFEVCRRIRQESPESDFYIILLTGSRMKEEIIKALVAGADDYLLKPFDPLDLKIRLRAARRIIDLQSALATAAR
jgi:DNA-binding response OmpR family regulator